MPEAQARATPWTPGAADPWPSKGGYRVLLIHPGFKPGDECWSNLENSGYEVRQVNDGAAADRLLREWSPDVILIDACDRRDLAVKWTQELNADPETTDIPVLALVPADEDVQTPGPLESAVDDCLTRPVRPWELLVRVRSLARLRRHRLELLDMRGLHGEQARMWGVLLEFTRAVPRTDELGALMDLIVKATAEMTSSRRVSLMLPDEDQQYLRIAGSIGLAEDLARDVRVPIGQAIAGRAYRTGRPVTNLEDQTAPADRRRHDFNSFVSMPMIYTTMSMVHQRVGVLNVANRYGDRPFEEWELEYIDLLGSIAGSAIDDIHSKTTRESLLRMERDLHLARQIQRSTFPSELPAMKGFQIAAWSEPAEETAGDTYDVIGCRHDGPDGTLVLSTDDADCAYLLLADATGHGIGPALSVTQVRAMLRMAVRMKPDLQRIIRHLNQQLVADLPGGRFVTSWLAEVDATKATLKSFSAGQAPIIRYDAKRDEWIVRPADTMPLGVANGLDINIAEPVTMHPGDIVAVLSDGIIEAENERGQKFGIDHVLRVLGNHRHEDPRGLQIAMRQEVQAFTRGAPAADDRTAIILKRVADG